MKRFYKNTLMSRAFSKVLRVVALLCVLFGVSSSAWGTTYYLWYNATSNEPNYKDSNFKMSSGATLTNNKCVWTISNLRKDNSYFYISTSSTYSESNLKSVNITTNNPNDAVVNRVGKQEYGGKVGFYVSCRAASSTVTITIDFSSNSQYVVSPTGGQVACTPSATITGASLSADKKTITLSGSLTTVCSATDTYYGWQYCTDGKSWSESNYVAGAPNDAHHSTTPVALYTNTWTGFSQGTTYYFRAYAYANNTFYSDNKILSVKIPEEGSASASCDVIEIYCKYLGATSQFDMKVHLGSDENDKSIHTGFASCDDSGDGYAHWTFDTDKTDVCIIISNKEENYKTGKMCGLSKGNKYYFDIPSSNWGSWTGGPTKTEALNCESNVLLSNNAIVDKNKKTAKLFGYLKATDCNRYTDYGFYYCTVNDGDAPCTPNTSSTKLAVDPSEELLRGTEFSATVKELEDGKTYYYRAYATSDKGTILSQEIRSFATDPCIPQVGGLSSKYVDGTPIVYTINAAPAFAANDCKLHFKSLQDAIDHLKKTNTRDDDYKYVQLSNGSYNLLQPVVMRVAYYDDTPDDDTKAFMYEGTTEYGITAGNDTPDHINLIADFNKNSSTPENTLSIKPLGSKAKPWIHHIVIRNSKNIVLDSLCIYSDISGKGDNALEIDVNSTDWGRLDIDPAISSVAPMLDANITIQNSMIGSVGFTGVHVSCYGGITFKNNDFECTYPGTEDNALRWGASAKFLACKDVKFIQNNFRGSQTSLLWIQESQNMLFMNNVFWNTNTNSTDKDQPIAAIRLVHQFNANTSDYKKKSKVKNISFFYNTFYLADDKKTSNHKYNFYCLSNSYDAHSSKDEFDLSSLYFKYNNCYSYDENLAGRSNNSGAFLGIDLTNNDNFCPNNFWSEYDQNKGNTTSDFAFGCSNNTFTNVKSQVCETSASGPASLIVKGSAMNTGAKLSVADIADKTGIELTDKESTSDRYLIGVRPKDDTWTMGAYQSKENIDTKVIYWVGVTDDWDDRNNWEYETEVDGKMVRQRVSCVNNFSEDLKVVIEEIGTVEVSGGRSWPKVPASFDANYRKENSKAKVPVGEQVSITGKYASTIELEYGAGLRGVENLKDSEDNVLYDQAIVHFDADRSKWLLVGNVIKPWDEKNKQYRSSVSGDYYLNHVPQVYMHKAELDGSDVVWNKTFANLDIPVPSNEVYAINVTGYYGTSWYPVTSYNKRYGTNYSDTEAQPYVFTGRFAITEETEGGNNFVYPSWQDKNLFNNVYPCNLNASYIDEHIGSVSIYDYEKGSFVPLAKLGSRADILIRSQNGFVIENNKGKSNFEITQDLLAGGSTRTRSTAIELPTFSLLVDNANTTAPGASNVIVRLDENQDLGYQSPFNTSKVFTQNENTPEAYLLSNDAMYSRLYIGKEVQRIPLGIRLRKGMNITFKQVFSEGFDKVILLDMLTGKEYNLLRRSYTTEMLPQGSVEGRFFLVLSVDEYDEFLPDDDITTNVDDVIESTDYSINIYAVDNSMVKVVANNVELQTIYISDMSGRTIRYDANGSYAELQLLGAQGVYVVQVIGDNLTRTEKVILK